MWDFMGGYALGIFLGAMCVLYFIHDNEPAVEYVYEACQAKEEYKF